MSASTTKRWLIISALVAAASQGVAQTSENALPFDFEYDRYDAAAPQLPADYSAKHYTAEELLKRLVMIAEGPELSREDLEAEFGLRFVKVRDGQHDGWVARGRYPLGNALSEYSDYRRGNRHGSVFLSLKLRDRTNKSGQPPQWNSPKLCVSVTSFYAGLSAAWRRIETARGSHHPLSIYFTREVAGELRTVQVAPPSRGRHSCLETFLIIYEARPAAQAPASR